MAIYEIFDSRRVGSLRNKDMGPDLVWPPSAYEVGEGRPSKDTSVTGSHKASSLVAPLTRAEMLGCRLYPIHICEKYPSY